jgi:hypothetical protein
MASSSSRLNTVPTGLAGLINTIIRVRSVSAAASAAASR